MSKGLLVDKAGLNCTDAADVIAINIGGQQASNASRRFMFKLDGSYCKLTTDNQGVATPVAVDTQDITIDSVLEEGNTAAELAAVQSCPSFGGKVVYPVIAMSGVYGSVQPTASLSFDKKTTADVYVYNDYSAEYDLTDGSLSAIIVSVRVDKELTGNATLEVYGSLYNGSSWSDWLNVQSIEGMQAQKIKFRSVYRIREFNAGDSAKINCISFIYGSNNAPVTGNEADLITITRDFKNDIGFAGMTVKHKKLEDGEFKAMVSLRDAIKSRESLDIGTGNGSVQTLILGLAGIEGQRIPDRGIDHNSLVIKVDGVYVSDFEFNMETSQVTLYADQNARITASYDYGWGNEEWRQMQQVLSEPYSEGDETIVATKFELAVADTGKQITNMCLRLTRNSGTVEDEVVGVATGKPQTIVLPHYARKDTLVCSADSFSYDDETRELSVVAPRGENITVSYEWFGSTQEIYAIAPMWAALSDVSQGGGAGEQGTSSVDITRIKTQLLYSQALLTELAEKIESLDGGN